MASLITWADKVTDVVSPLPAEKKLTSADATEIKTVVNANATELANRPGNVQDSDNTFDVDTGAADAYVITLNPAITAYAKGQLFSFDATNANLTTTPTIDVNGVGAQTITNRNGTALAPGDIPANSNNIIQYDGVNFQLMTSVAWIRSLTIGDVSAIQNTVTSDITAQTTGAGDPTFTGLDWDIDVTGRTSTGDVNFLDFKKTDATTASVFKVDINGNVTMPTGDLIVGSTSASFGILLPDDDNKIYRTTANTIGIKIGGTDRFNFTGSIFQSAAASGFTLTFANSSATDPTFRPNKNANTTGWGGIAGELSGITGGVQAININASQITTTLSQLKTTASTTLAAINIGSFAGDPSVLADGDYWTNSSTNKLRARENGESVDVISSGVIQKATVFISSAELLSINSAPKTLIAAQGSLKLLIIHSLFIEYSFSTTAYAGDTSLFIEYGTTNVKAATSSFDLSAASGPIFSLDKGEVTTDTSILLDNKAVVLTNVTSNPTTGDGTMVITMEYSIMDI